MTGATIPELEAATDMERLKGLCERSFVSAEGERIVFGEGPTDARLMLIGEAPGTEEAKTGRPFVGNSGRLLNKYLQLAGIERDKVYVTNVLKTRPPGNRTPRRSEVGEALPYLLRQMALIRPSIVVCLGSIAVQAVIDPKAKVTQIRGQWTEKDGIRVMPTYHPSAVFRDEEKKELLKRDLIEVGTMVRELR